jgi:hypothetical protein
MPSVRERLRTGKVPLAGFLNLIPSPVATQALAAAGADVVAIDQEHGPIGPESLHAMVASTAGTPCSPWVRVPGLRSGRREDGAGRGRRGHRVSVDHHRGVRRRVRRADPISPKGGEDGGRSSRTPDGAWSCLTTWASEAARRSARS